MALLARDECEHPIFGSCRCSLQCRGRLWRHQRLDPRKYAVGCHLMIKPNDCTSTAHGWGMLNSLSCRICCVPSLTVDLTCSLLMFLCARRKTRSMGICIRMAQWLFVQQISQASQVATSRRNDSWSTICVLLCPLLAKVAAPIAIHSFDWLGCSADWSTCHVSIYGKK